MPRIDVSLGLRIRRSEQSRGFAVVLDRKGLMAGVARESNQAKQLKRDLRFGRAAVRTRHCVVRQFPVDHRYGPKLLSVCRVPGCRLALLCLLFACARRGRCRAHDDEIGEFPRKWRFLPAIRRPSVARHLHRRVQFLPPVGVPPVPGDDDRKLGCLVLQLTETVRRATAHDNFERFFFCRRRTAAWRGRGRGLCGHVRPSYRLGTANSLIVIWTARACLSA